VTKSRALAPLLNMLVTHLFLEKIAKDFLFLFLQGLNKVIVSKIAMDFEANLKRKIVKKMLRYSARIFL
jgi:hypothetical protein